MREITVQACVLGVGAGGYGAVYRLLKRGVQTVAVDRNPDFGGTATFCGVSGWEPGVTLDGVHTLLAERLEKTGEGFVVEKTSNGNFFAEKRNLYTVDRFDLFPWGLSVKSERGYESTLKRCPPLRGEQPLCRFQFDEDAMKRAMHAVLAPYKQWLTALFGYSFVACETDGRYVRSVTVENGEERVKIKADYFIDGTGEIVLAHGAGCQTRIGTESPTEYGEPSAVDHGQINGVTYCFRFQKTENSAHIDELPSWCEEVEDEVWLREKRSRTVSCFTFYPNGDVNVNMLPTMEGKEYFALGARADEVGRARVYHYWRYLQTEKGLQGFTLTKIFDAGVREGRRLVGRYVLTENDVRAGMNNPRFGEMPIVAVADHALDIHGSNGLCKELLSPYGVPLSCALPKEYDNLAVASRGASFTHIASSSVRLIRTMLSFGEGVGEYVADQILLSLT